MSQLIHYINKPNTINIGLTSTNPIPLTQVLHKRHVQFLGCHCLILVLNSFKEVTFLISSQIIFKSFELYMIPFPYNYEQTLHLWCELCYHSLCYMNFILAQTFHLVFQGVNCLNL